MNDSATPETVFDFSGKALNGTEVDFNIYRGRVLLIVNTASKCGFTSQYEGLENLHRQYAQRGLAILGFPCNQFAGQEPGAAEEIAVFCAQNYGVSFPMFDKIDVNGDHAAPLFRYLKHAAPGLLGTEAIKWNFTKFLVAKDGKTAKRYAPTTKPEELLGDIEKSLAE